MSYTRKTTKPVYINNLRIGGTDHVIIQSMTNTKTANIKATLKQISDLKDAGCELVRVAVFDDNDADILKDLILQSPLPLVADIHFNFNYALIAINSGFKKIRLNPGNLDDPNKLQIICKAAKENNVTIRVGVNSGSLPQHIINKYGITAIGIVEAAKHYINLLNNNDFDNIVVSLKSSDPLIMIDAYEKASKELPYPLHLGVTEAGTLLEGTIKSIAGLAPLLTKGIGDTIRISLTDDPVNEVKVARKLLNTLGLRNDLVDIISCPTCGRLNFDMIPLVNKIKSYTENMFFPLKISILGCVVNGIGEGKEADIGVAGSINKGIIFKKGKIIKTVSENEIFNELKQLIDEEYQKYLVNKK